MPVPLEVFDISWSNVELPEPGASSFAIPLGGEWRPNDWRIMVASGQLWQAISFIDSYNSGTFRNVWAPAPAPAGWSVLGTWSFIIQGHEGTMAVALGRRLQEGDAEPQYSIINPAGAHFHPGLPNYLAWFNAEEQPAMLAFTVRGVDPTFTPTCVVPTTTGSGTAPYTLSHASRSIGATPGFELFAMGFWPGNGPTPSGWTALWDNGYSFSATVRPSYVGKTMGLIGKKYTSGTTSGTTSLVMQDGILGPGNPKPVFGGQSGVILYSPVLYFKQAQDVSVTVGTATAETDTANAATPSVSTAVTVVVGTATQTTHTAGQVFSALTGYGIHDPYILPGTPVLSSIVRWTEVVATGARVTVHTSLDWGVTWTQATNGQPVPGLRVGDTNVDAVLARVTLNRDSTAIATPKVYLDVQISCDSGRTELLPTGTFLLKATDIDIGSDGGGAAQGGSAAGVVGSGGGYSGGGTAITLKGSDLSLAIAEHVWQQPYFITAGTNYGDALRAMVADRLPSQTRYSIATTLEETPLLVYGTRQGADPWQDIRELAIAIGWDAYFDPYGTFTCRPVLDPAVAVPVWTFTDLAGPPITAIKRGLTRDEVYNWIIVEGEAVSPQTGREVVPVRAEARNLDPNHPTFIGGKFGIKPYKVTLQAVTSPEQAQVAADALLLLLKEGAETVEITVPPNPALEPGDVIALNIDDANVDGNYVIHGLEIPSSAARGQRLTCYRQSRVA